MSSTVLSSRVLRETTNQHNNVPLRGALQSVKDSFQQRDAKREMTTPHKQASSSYKTPKSGATTKSSCGPTPSPFSRHSARSTEGDDCTPQRPLFQWPYLLRELPVGEAAPVLTVVLDLDETLVSNRRMDLPQAILRPYAIEVLNALRGIKGVEIVLWTASTEVTGAPVVRQLHAHGHIFDDVIYRDDRWFTEPTHTKDLTLLGRNMDRVVVVDNAPNCCKFNKDHSVIIDDFRGVVTPSDTHLISVYKVIQHLAQEIVAQSKTVPEALYALAKRGSFVKPSFVPLPEAWRHVDLNDFAPLLVPATGRFFSTVACAV